MSFIKKNIKNIAILIILIGLIYTYSKYSSLKGYVANINYNSFNVMCSSLDILTDTSLDLDKETKLKLNKQATLSSYNIYDDISKAQKYEISTIICDIGKIEDREVLARLNETIEKFSDRGMAPLSYNKAKCIGDGLELEGTEVKMLLDEIDKIIKAYYNS